MEKHLKVIDQFLYYLGNFTEVFDTDLMINLIKKLSRFKFFNKI